jgi:GDPmannose 4,6-dehydratase
LHLGNLEAKRDWGHARDYVQAMHLMMIADSPDDYVVATSQTYTVQQFLDKAFALINEDPKDYVYIDPDLYRPCEVNYLKGDYSKAKIKLDWEPRVSFDQLVHEMVFSDIERYKHEEKL